MAEQALPPDALHRRREWTIARLCEHFAHDRLGVAELERRLDRAHRAATAAELDELLGGLPALAEPAPEARLPERTGRSEQQTVLAIMGGVERTGTWSPASSLYVVALMGGVLLDFRHTALPRGITEVYVLALMGGVEIVVPPGIHVESNGVGVMGGFSHRGDGKFPVDGRVPVLRVTGAALMGGVEIRTRAPREEIRAAPDGAAPAPDTPP